MVDLYENDQLSIGLLTETAERAELIRIFRQISDEAGWQPGEGLDFVDQTCLIAAANVKGEILGGIALTTTDGSGTLPICATWPEIRIEDNSWELAALGLQRSSRNVPQLLWSLCTEMWRFACAAGARYLYVEVTLRNYRVYQRMGWGLEVLGPERLHWGEPCIPCKMDLAAVSTSALRVVDRSPLLSSIRAQAFRDQTLS